MMLIPSWTSEAESEVVMAPPAAWRRSEMMSKLMKIRE